MSLSRYAVGQASQPGVAISILTAGHRDLRESIEAAKNKSCTGGCTVAPGARRKKPRAERRRPRRAKIAG